MEPTGRRFPCLHRKHPRYLGHGLDNEYARHNRMIGEVAGEERFVDGDVLVTLDALTPHQLGDPVDQQKRIAVGQVLGQALDVEGLLLTLVHRIFRSSRATRLKSSSRR